MLLGGLQGSLLTPCLSPAQGRARCLKSGMALHSAFESFKNPKSGTFYTEEKDLAPGYGIRLYQAHSLKKSPLVFPELWHPLLWAQRSTWKASFPLLLTPVTPWCGRPGLSDWHGKVVFAHGLGWSPFFWKALPLGTCSTVPTSTPRCWAPDLRTCPLSWFTVWACLCSGARGLLQTPTALWMFLEARVCVP